MSEFYYWVNVDKKQFLSPNDFGCSGRCSGSMHKNGSVLSALYALLSDELEWKGNRIVYLGEDCKMPSQPSLDVLRILHEDTLRIQEHGNYYDTIIETYWNRTAQFRSAEKELRPEIEDTLAWIKANGSDWSTDNFFREFQIDPSHPFNGLFWKDGAHFRYVINHSKQMYYDLEHTVIRYKDGVECTWADPLPNLMVYGRVGGTGPWLGDIIDVGNAVNERYSYVSEIYLDW